MRLVRIGLCRDLAQRLQRLELRLEVLGQVKLGQDKRGPAAEEN